MPGKWSFSPLLLVCLVPLFWVIFKAKRKSQAIWAGGLFGLVYYLLILYWIVIVLGRYGGLPAYASIPALIGLAGYMTLYSIFFTTLCFFFVQKNQAQWSTFLFPALWVAGDWLRAILFTGFPWLDLGYGFWNSPELIQSAEIFGHHGITFLIVQLNVFLTLLLLRKVTLKQHTAWLLPVLLLPVYSYFSLQQKEKNAEFNKVIEVGIVQGNVLQNDKWAENLKLATVKKYLALSKSIPGHQQLDLLVWPETALPFFPHIADEFRLISQFLKNGQKNLLTGSPWYEIDKTADKEIHYYNSALLLNEQSRLMGIYYKSHLVPYGEYIPLKKYTPFLEPLVHNAGNFTPGVIEQPLKTGSANVGVLICYESIFPEIGRKWVERGADLLVNLTNDAWYGNSSAPYQSFAMTVFRAVETGRSVVRAANTGFSGFIQPTGKVHELSPLFMPWAKKHSVILNKTTTPFVVWGYLFAPFCFLYVCLAFLMTVTKREKRFH